MSGNYPNFSGHCQRITHFQIKILLFWILGSEEDYEFGEIIDGRKHKL